MAEEQATPAIEPAQTEEQAPGAPQAPAEEPQKVLSDEDYTQAAIRALSGDEGDSDGEGDGQPAPEGQAEGQEGAEEGDKPEDQPERKRWEMIRAQEAHVRRQREEVARLKQESEAEIAKLRAEVEEQRRQAGKLAEVAEKARQGDYSGLDEVGIDYQKWATQKLTGKSAVDAEELAKKLTGPLNEKLEALQKELETERNARAEAQQAAAREGDRSTVRAAASKEPERWELTLRHPGYEEEILKAAEIMYQNAGSPQRGTPEFQQFQSQLQIDKLLDRMEMALEQDLRTRFTGVKKVTSLFGASPSVSDSTEPASQPNERDRAPKQPPKSLTNAQAAETTQRSEYGRTDEEREQLAIQTLRRLKGQS